MHLAICGWWEGSGCALMVPVLLQAGDRQFEPQADAKAPYCKSLRLEIGVGRVAFAVKRSFISL